MCYTGFCIQTWLLIVSVPIKSITVEPLIVGTPKSGQTPYNGQTACPLPTTVGMLENLTRRDNLRYNGQNTRPQRVHCSEVPLYHKLLIEFLISTFRISSLSLSHVQSPSVYSSYRHKALEFTFSSLSGALGHHAADTEPLFLYGDFNFRLDFSAVVKVVCYTVFITHTSFTT